MVSPRQCRVMTQKHDRLWDPEDVGPGLGVVLPEGLRPDR